jgi:hypothetical protein
MLLPFPTLVLALRHFHEQLHRADLDAGHDQRGDRGSDENLRMSDPPIRATACVLNLRPRS